MFTNRFYIGRKVEDDFCSLQGQGRTWRNRRPKIIAQFDAETSFRCIEKQVVSKRNILSAEANGRFGM